MPQHKEGQIVPCAVYSKYTYWFWTRAGNYKVSKTNRKINLSVSVGTVKS